MSDDRKPQQEPDDVAAPPGKQRDFVHRMVLMDGVAFLFILVLAAIWFAAEALLLVFACILFAILLFDLSNIVHMRLGVRRRLALPFVVIMTFGLIGAGLWLMAPQLSDQADKLADAVPKAITELRMTLAQYDLLHRLLGSIPSDEQLRAMLARMVPNAGLFFTGILGALGNVLIILCVGLGYVVVMWALKLVGLTIEPRIIQICFAIIVVLVLIWFVGSICTRPDVRVDHEAGRPRGVCVN